MEDHDLKHTAIYNVFKRLSPVDQLIFYAYFVQQITMQRIAEIVTDSQTSGKQNIWKNKVQKYINLINEEYEDLRLQKNR